MVGGRAAKLDSGDSFAFPNAFLNGGDPVLAPDGRTVFFSRLKLVKTLRGRESYLFKTAVWALNVERGSVQRLTRWRLAASIDPISFSPDSSSIVVELLDRTGLRIVAIDVDSRRSRRSARLARDAREPTYSPDDTKLAFVRDKSAGSICRSRTGGSASCGLPARMQRRAAPTAQEGLTRVFTDPGLILSDVAWRPGPGREAAPISC